MHDSSSSGLIVYAPVGPSPHGAPRRPLLGRLAESLASAFAGSATTVQSSALAGRRIEALDAARLVAVLGLLIVHTPQSRLLGPLGLLGTFGVPFYVFASLYMQARSLRRHPERLVHRYIVARFRRLYVPFLAWGVIYLIARNAKHLLLLQDGPVAAHVWQLWTGTSYHLWFLPFLFMVSISVEILHRLLGATPQGRWAVILASAITGMALAVVPRPQWFDQVRGEEGNFFLFCWKALPGALLGLSLAWTLAWRRVDNPVTAVASIFGALITVTMLSMQLAFGYSRLDRTLSGLGWFLAGLGPWRGLIVMWLARFGRYGYGIYLSHVLFIDAMQAVTNHAGMPRTASLDLLTMAFALTCSTITAIMLQRRPSLAWLNG